jgi:hypothetical protein
MDCTLFFYKTVPTYIVRKKQKGYNIIMAFCVCFICLYGGFAIRFKEENHVKKFNPSKSA